MFHEILGFVIGYVCRKSAEMCQKRAGNLENDSARSCSCFLMLLFIWRAKKRVKLGVVIFRCFKITACFALIELQYVKENSNNPLIIFQEMFFILLYLFCCKILCIFLFCDIGVPGEGKIANIVATTRQQIYSIYIHMCAIGVAGEGKIANMVATTRRQNIFSNTQTIFQYSIISFILYIYMRQPLQPPLPPTPTPLWWCMWWWRGAEVCLQVGVDASIHLFPLCWGYVAVWGGQECMYVCLSVCM